MLRDRPIAAAAALVLVVGAFAAVPVKAEEQLTIVGWGGAWQEAYRKAVFEPFAKETGIKVIEEEYDGELAKIRAQVESGAITWDIVSVEGAELLIGCDEGLYEKMDWEALGGRDKYLDYAVADCGMASDVWAGIMAYDGDKVTGDVPKSWADFWNVEKWPGNRGMRATPTETVEYALLADGVAKQDIYTVLREPGGLDRAFKKLDELKPHIVWYKTGAECADRLGTGEVVMTACYNGRIAALARENKRNLVVAWEVGFLGGIDQFVQVKGAPNQSAAQKWWAYFARPEVQAEFMRQIAYGTAHKDAYALLSPEIKADLPTSPEKAEWIVGYDYGYWLEHKESATERFNAWSAQ